MTSLNEFIHVNKRRKKSDGIAGIAFSSYFTIYLF